jgi:Gpi18-like mannosyltransferase
MSNVWVFSFVHILSHYKTSGNLFIYLVVRIYAFYKNIYISKNYLNRAGKKREDLIIY